MGWREIERWVGEGERGKSKRGKERKREGGRGRYRER